MSETRPKTELKIKPKTDPEPLSPAKRLAVSVCQKAVKNRPKGTSREAAIENLLIQSIISDPSREGERRLSGEEIMEIVEQQSVELVAAKRRDAMDSVWKNY